MTCGGTSSTSVSAARKVSKTSDSMLATSRPFACDHGGNLDRLPADATTILPPRSRWTWANARSPDGACAEDVCHQHAHRPTHRSTVRRDTKEVRSVAHVAIVERCPAELDLGFTWGRRYRGSQ